MKAADKSELSRLRLHRATQALKDAADEFIKAHAAWSGGHRPVLWATYYNFSEALVVCPKSWVEFLQKHFQGKGEPMVNIALDDLNEELEAMPCPCRNWARWSNDPIGDPHHPDCPERVE